MLDLGAYEMEDGQPADLVVTTSGLPSGTVGTAYNATLAASGGAPPYFWAADGLPGGLSVNRRPASSAGRRLRVANSTWTRG